MNTLKNFCAGISSVPAAAAWYLADLGELFMASEELPSGI